MNNCSIESCDLPAASLKMCRIHYQRYKRGDRGDRLTRPIKKYYNENCSVNNCINKHKSKGYCSTHLLRINVKGSLLEDVAIGEIPPQKKYISCKVANCVSTYRMNYGYCNAHYLRLRRHGNPTGGRNDEMHGESRTKLYKVYRSMINRCYRPSVKGYERYGGRGIKVCDRWLNSYTLFKKDMGEKPTAQHSIDRIDNDGNYEPSNCRWATKEIQMRNRGLIRNAKTPYTGVYKKGNKYSVECNRNNLGVYDTLEEAISARLMAESIYWS